MNGYRVIFKNYKDNDIHVIGSLMERRTGIRGKINIANGLKWARLIFGKLLHDPNAIYVIPICL